MALYWDGNRGEYVTADEHFGYTFDHDWSTRIDDLDCWMDENGISDAGKARLEDDHVIEYDYETCDWYITPEDVDVLAYVDDDDIPTVAEMLADDGITTSDIEATVAEMTERMNEMLEGYSSLFWSDTDKATFATLQSNKAALLMAEVDIIAARN